MVFFSFNIYNFTVSLIYSCPLLVLAPVTIFLSAFSRSQKSWALPTQLYVSLAPNFMRMNFIKSQANNNSSLKHNFFLVTKRTVSITFILMANTSHFYDELLRCWASENERMFKFEREKKQRTKYVNRKTTSESLKQRYHLSASTVLLTTQPHNWWQQRRHFGSASTVEICGHSNRFTMCKPHKTNGSTDGHRTWIMLMNCCPADDIDNDSKLTSDISLSSSSTSPSSCCFHSSGFVVCHRVPISCAQQCAVNRRHECRSLRNQMINISIQLNLFETQNRDILQFHFLWLLLP